MKPHQPFPDFLTHPPPFHFIPKGSAVTYRTETRLRHAVLLRPQGGGATVLGPDWDLKYKGGPCPPNCWMQEASMYVPTMYVIISVSCFFLRFGIHETHKGFSCAALLNGGFDRRRPLPEI